MMGPKLDHTVANYNCDIGEVLEIEVDILSLDLFLTWSIIPRTHTV